MRLKDILDYYSRDNIQKALLDVARDREVVGVFGNGSFDKRPNTIMYPEDIVSMVRNGVVEFHCSIERWSRPMALRQDNYDELRNGWDLLLDLDCKVFEHGKAAAVVVCKTLEKHDIKGYSIKFTGGKGFHIGIPWESFPREVNFRPTVKQFPDLARHIAEYLRDFSRADLEDELLKKFGTPEMIAEQMQVPLGDIMGAKDKESDDKIFDPFNVVDIDPVLISPRHLFRMPYSLNKKSYLVSLPMRPEELEGFRKDHARPGRTRPVVGFLDNGKPDEAEALVGEAVDWHTRKAIVKKKSPAPIIRPGERLGKGTFPPCINNILKGLRDGRKRSLFILTNFLSSAGWTVEEIEKLLIEWNSKNTPSLRDNYIKMHVRWYQGRIRAGQKKMPPPGCFKEGYYVSIGVCRPDNVCGGQSKSIKNPLNYAVKKEGSRKAKYKSAGKGRGRKNSKPVYIE